ncbi:MAG: isochorismate synthase MenF [Acidimicrobiales bacterium]
MRATTVRLDRDVDPLAIGSRTGLLWSRPGHDDPVPLLAGVGEAARIPVIRPDGAAAAQAALTALAAPADDDLTSVPAGPGPGPVAFAAIPFDRERSGELIVPELAVGPGADGRRWVTAIDDGSGPAPGGAAVLDRLQRMIGPDPAIGATPPQATTFPLAAVLAPERWRDDVVGRAVGEIRSGRLAKVVLARELRLATDAPADPAAVVGHLRATFGSAIVFLIDGFVGASPELLVSRHGDVVRAHPLAGTAPRGADPAIDAHLAAGLLASTKDRWEHRITIDWLLDGLLPFCSYVDAEPEPTIVSLANVHHLGTRVEGRLSWPAASVLELVAALHPTPAVGGEPQAEALALMAELEKADRGRYAGPVGWVDAAGNGSFAVGIRSAELDGGGARLFAGVGVVADSDPAAELEETRAKFRAMLGALIRP